MSHPTPQKNLGNLVGNTAKVMGRFLLERFRQAGYDITREQYWILLNLWRQDGLSQYQLGDICGLDKTSMTRAIDSLEVKNLVLRVPDQMDRRQKRVYLTHEGKQFENEMNLIGAEVSQYVTQGLDPRELEITERVLQHIQENLKAYL